MAAPVQVCSIRFVRDVLFPYALAVLPSFLRAQWHNASFAPYRDAFPQEARDTPEHLEEYVRELSAKDVKDSCLKQLQGLLWRTGYETGDLKAPIYDDVLPALKHWTGSAGLIVAIYSSGSIAAQKLLFTHTTTPEKDLTKYFKAYFDTVNAGSKTDPNSYLRIADALGVEPRECLFLSDNVDEIAAALSAKMDAAVVVRPGNVELMGEDRSRYRVVEKGFGELSLS